MSEQSGSNWDWWSGRKAYNSSHLEIYYAIRQRNLQWLTDLSLSYLSTKRPCSILKTDLWNEAKKDEPFFAEADGVKVGIDVSGSICKMARSKHGGTILITQGSIEALPFASDSFDIVWDISTIDHSERPEKVIDEYSRILKPNGVLLLVAENPLCLSYPVTKIQSLVKKRVIVKSGVSASESSGDLVNFVHLYSISEFCSRNYLRQVVKPAQATPFFLCTHSQLEHHVQHAIS
mgnify:CR=1 FL=1